MGTKRLASALSIALAAFRTLQPEAFGLLNRLVPLVLAYNYYVARPEATYFAPACHYNVGTFSQLVTVIAMPG